MRKNYYNPKTCTDEIDHVNGNGIKDNTYMVVTVESVTFFLTGDLSGSGREMYYSYPLVTGSLRGQEGDLYHHYLCLFPPGLRKRIMKYITNL